jgi:hypothetical protein
MIEMAKKKIKTKNVKRICGDCALWEEVATANDIPSDIRERLEQRRVQRGYSGNWGLCTHPKDGINLGPLYNPSDYAGKDQTNLSFCFKPK